jgi:hypothetical protein
VVKIFCASITNNASLEFGRVDICHLIWVAWSVFGCVVMCHDYVWDWTERFLKEGIDVVIPDYQP